MNPNPNPINQTTFPITHDTIVPWPCWVRLNSPEIWQWYESWPFKDHPADHCSHYSTLPAEKIPNVWSSRSQSGMSAGKNSRPMTGARNT